MTLKNILAGSNAGAVFVGRQNKKRAPEEQNRNEPERIEQIGQVRGPIGYSIRHAWEAGEDVAQEEANARIEDHRARDEPNRDHPGPPQPETHAGGDVERAKQERILDSARESARVHLQIAVVTVQDVGVPDLAEQVAVGSDGDKVKPEEDIIELGNGGDNTEQEREASEDGEPERAPGSTLERGGLIDACGHRVILPWSGDWPISGLPHADGVRYHRVKYITLFSCDYTGGIDI